jgi:hypothetical protein
MGYDEVVAEVGRATDDEGARRLAGIVDVVAERDGKFVILKLSRVLTEPTEQICRPNRCSSIL